VVDSVVVVDSTSGDVVAVVDAGAVETGAVAGVLPTVVHPPTHAAATARTTMAKDRIWFNHTDPGRRLKTPATCRFPVLRSAERW